MTTQQQQIEKEISLIDILLFLNASVRKVITSTILCLLIGTAYYFAMPKVYEATATIQMAVVAGEAVETPAILLEKMKLPMFFSATALQACGADGDLSSHTKFADKLKPTLNKSAPLISISVQARSSQEARVCLDAVISEIQKSQNELAKPVIENKKQTIDNLRNQLKIAEEISKGFPANQPLKNLANAEYNLLALVIPFKSANAAEISELKRKIQELETDLIPPQTQPLSLATPMYAPEVSNNKRPVFTLGLSLALGLFLGLLITGLQRLLPEIRQQMREAMANRV